MRSKAGISMICICMVLLITGGPLNASQVQAYTVEDVVFSKLDVGYATSCAITDTDRLVCWGDNYEGQLGVENSDLYYSPIPIRPTGLEANIVSVSSGEDHTCAIADDGTTWCWGYGEYGQLGYGVTESSAVPVQVDASTGFSSPLMISANSGETCGFTTSGAAFCWGDGDYGQLGNGTNVDSDVPSAITLLSSGTKYISVGYNFACAINSTDGAMCWGSNNWGNLGNGTTTSSNVPVNVLTLSAGVTQIAAGDLHACALVNGGVKCWGYNGDGELGNGTLTNSSTPVSVSTLTTGVSAITVGSYHSCALVSGGVRCWGDGSDGKLGNGSEVSSNVPVQVTGMTEGVIAISAGGYHTCALLASGEIKCWGYNGSGELGTGDFDTRLTPDESVVMMQGCVSGSAVYLGTKFSTAHDIFVTAHPSLDSIPVESDVILSGEWYLLPELEDGSYYISAFLDANDSGGDPPDAGEPTTLYDENDDGIPDMITIIDGANVADIRLYLYDPRLIFIPLVSR